MRCAQPIRATGWIAIAALLFGCNPVYAPPVRATHAGAPARLEAERMEIGGAAAGLSNPMAGGPHVAVGLEDWLSLEAGGNFNFFAQGWALGWLGARLTRPPEYEVDWVGDLELGGGLGVGGASCASGECGTWSEILAGGGYGGFGVGIRADVATVYVRSRLEVSAARDIPVTFWPTAMLGVDFLIERVFAFGAGGGYLGLGNEHEWYHGYFYQLQVAILFDLPSQPEEPSPPINPYGLW